MLCVELGCSKFCFPLPNLWMTWSLPSKNSIKISVAHVTAIDNRPRCLPKFYVFRCRAAIRPIGFSAGESGGSSGSGNCSWRQAFPPLAPLTFLCILLLPPDCVGRWSSNSINPAHSSSQPALPTHCLRKKKTRFVLQIVSNLNEYFIEEDGSGCLVITNNETGGLFNKRETSRRESSAEWN